MALEVGTQSAWIAREFARLGHEVIVANARELKWITSSDDKNDRNDARKLARLARADRSLLAPVEHRTAEQQAELAVIRARDALVRSRTLLVNTARSLAKGFGLRLPASITTTFGARALAGLAEHLRTAMSGLLEQIDLLSGKIGDYDQRVKEVAARHPEVERLASVPGVWAARKDSRTAAMWAVSWACVRGNGNRASAIRSWGLAKAATSICANCWCSARITSSGIGAKIRR